MTVKITQEQIAQLHATYAGTNNVARAAAAAGMSRSSAYYHLAAAGHQFGKEPPLAELVALRDEGMNYRSLAAHFGVTIGTIHAWMNKAGRAPQTRPLEE